MGVAFGLGSDNTSLADGDIVIGTKGLVTRARSSADGAIEAISIINAQGTADQAFHQIPDRIGADAIRETFTRQTDELPSNPRIHFARLLTAGDPVPSESERRELKDAHHILAMERPDTGLRDVQWLNGKDFLIIRGICGCVDGEMPECVTVAAENAAHCFRILLGHC